MSAAKGSPMLPLGDAIRERRVAARMTLRAMAKALGVSAPFMSDVEHGRRRLSEDKVVALEKLFRCKRGELGRHVATREVVYWLERDPELLELVRRARRESRYRALVLGGSTERERVLRSIELYVRRFDGAYPIGVSDYGVPIAAITGYCQALREDGNP